MSDSRNGRTYPPPRRTSAASGAAAASGATAASDATATSGAAPEPRSDTSTPRLGLVQPEVGASASTWGNKLNSNMAILDNAITTAGGEIGGFLAVDTLSVNDSMALGGPGIQYTSLIPGHAIGFGWSTNGTVQQFVDTNFEGDLATQQWVNANFPGWGYANANYATYAWVEQNFALASNVLSPSGGTITGNLSVNGTANLNHVSVFSTGISYPGVGSSHAIAFGWDNAFLQAYVDGGYIGDFAPRAGRDAMADAVGELKAETAALAARLRALEERL